MHAKGVGSFGEFELTQDMKQYTDAKFLHQTPMGNKKTRLFARFSTVAGERGYPDTVRDTKGAAFKLYTEEGNLDWAFLNPVNSGLLERLCCSERYLTLHRRYFSFETQRSSHRWCMQPSAFHPIIYLIQLWYVLSFHGAIDIAADNRIVLGVRLLFLCKVSCHSHSAVTSTTILKDIMH